MKTIRKGIFETNSSMTHSLVIGTKEEFGKWRAGEMLYDRWGDNKFVTKEEMEKLIKDGTYDEEDFKAYEDFISDNGYYSLECDGGSFTTPSGDEIEWVAVYGRDG